MKLCQFFIVMCATLSSAFIYKGIPQSVQIQKQYKNRRQRTELNASNQLGLGVGSVGLIALLANRLAGGLELASEAQSRADIISVIACSAVLLDWLSDQEVKTKERQSVALAGYALPKYEVSDSNAKSIEIISWAMKTLLDIKSVTSVHILTDSTRFIGRCGVVSFADKSSNSLDSSNMPILREVLQTRKQVYLPDLQILPGKVEFSYLPLNCQSVMIVPLLYSPGGAVILGTNQAKSFELRDLSATVAAVDIFESLYGRASKQSTAAA